MTVREFSAPLRMLPLFAPAGVALIPGASRLAFVGRSDECDPRAQVSNLATSRSTRNASPPTTACAGSRRATRSRPHTPMCSHSRLRSR